MGLRPSAAWVSGSTMDLNSAIDDAPEASTNG
jgi:hypothetical protein